MGRVEGKVAIVTGAASNPGLGYATAHRLAEEGARLVVSDVDADGAEACAESLRQAGGEAVALRQDVTSESQWREAVDKALSAYGKIDILVNNAGIAVLKMIEDMQLSDFERQMQVNMTSVFLGTKMVMPHMRANGGGSIVNLSSILGLIGIPGGSAYAASKGGVRLFTKTIALEGAKDQIRCNSVHPGVIWTNIQKVALQDNPGQYDIINASIPMGRMGEALDIANCILFLASDEAKYITGAEFVVDGGITAQ